MRSICFLCVSLGMFVSLGAHDFSIHSGYRWDRLHLRGDSKEEIQSAELSIEAEFCLSQRLLLEGELGFGVVLDGRHSWLAYSPEGSRTQVDKRSGGYLLDGTVDIGWVIPLQDAFWCCLIPKVGAAFNYLELAWREAISLGPWLGVESRWKVGARSCIRAEARIQYGFHAWQEYSFLPEPFWGVEARTYWDYSLTDSVCASLGFRACLRRASMGERWESWGLFAGLRF